jgi:hypothetical protein
VNLFDLRRTLEFKCQWVSHLCNFTKGNTIVLDDQVLQTTDFDVFLYQDKQPLFWVFHFILTCHDVERITLDSGVLNSVPFALSTGLP